MWASPAGAPSQREPQPLAPFFVAAVQPSGHRLCCLPLLPALLLAGAPSQRESHAPLLLPPLCSYAAPWLPLDGVAIGDVAPCCP